MKLVYRITGSIFVLFLSYNARPQATTVTATPGSSAAPSTPPIRQWTSEDASFRLQMIGNSHIDAVWLWPFSEANAVVHSTFRSALDRLRETPALTMTSSSSQFYEWIAASDPAMIAEIRKRVDEGRWNLVGGWWCEPDVNIPNGESLMRQGLYGQATLQRLFGRISKVGFNPDSFGHTAGLPQILKLQRMNSYVFMRPSVTEKASVTQNLFQWQGIDGTRVLTYRIPLAYDDAGDVRSHMQREIKLLSGQPEKNFMEFFGIGDHGGGPTKANIASIAQIQSETGAPTIVYSTPERYFASVRDHLPLSTQIVNEDLQHHSVGAYTAGSDLKKLNRTTEAMLLASEEWNAIGSIAWGADYPKAEFTEAWKRVLLMQFHDSMAGTALPSQFLAGHDAFGGARDVATRFQDRALMRLAWQIPAVDPDSQYLIVFNSHAWPVKMHPEYDLQWRPADGALVEDADGHPIPFQWNAPTTAVNNRLGLLAEVEVPAFGYQQIRVRKSSAPVLQEQGELHADNTHLENAHLRVTLKPDGIQIVDKETGRDVFLSGESGMQAIVYDDPSDTWSHGVRAYDKKAGSFQQTASKVVENGPLRAKVRQQSSFGASTLTVDWTLYEDSRSLQASVTLDWHEHRRMMKFVFPVAVDKPEVTYETAYGAISRGNQGDEDPGQRWIDVSGITDRKVAGLTVINDAKYGYSVNGTAAAISVVRSPVYANHDPYKLAADQDYLWMDQGVQSLHIVLQPHSGLWQSAQPARLADELVTAIPVLYQGIHPGTRSTKGSYLSVDNPNIIISAVKQAEDGQDIIIRSYESTGRPARATLNLRFVGTHWTGNYHPYEIKTLRVSTKTHVIREVDGLEQ